MDSFMITPEIQKTTQEIEETFMGVEVYAVNSHEDRGAAIEQCAAIKRKAKQLDELRRTMTKPLDDSKRAIMEFFERPQFILKRAEDLIKGAVITWDKEQSLLAERQRRELQAKADADAKKEKERLEAEAVKAIEEGNELKAAEMIMQSEEVEHVRMIVPQPEKQKGAATRTVWKARIIDATLIPNKYMIPNMQMLCGIATATKQASEIPGVEFYQEVILAVKK